jgi:hypothetical protein
VIAANASEFMGARHEREREREEVHAEAAEEEEKRYLTEAQRHRH